MDTLGRVVAELFWIWLLIALFGWWGLLVYFVINMLLSGA